MPVAAHTPFAPNPAAELDGFAVLVSASMPASMAFSFKAYKLQDFFVTFSRGLLDLGGTLIFGGHPSITPLVRRIAYEFSGPPRVELFQWTRYRDEAPPEAHDTRVFNVHWIDGDSIGPMREAMIDKARAAVFLGGKTLAENPVGGKSGIRDEYERYLLKRPQGPAYLLGLLEGEARLLIDEGCDEPNSLAKVEKDFLHQNEDPALAASLILADLARQARAERAKDSLAAHRGPAVVVPLAAKKR